jgi:hypothetical protein
VKHLLAVIVVLAVSAASAGAGAPISIRVNQNGVMCEVLNRITECSMLPDVLAQEFGTDRTISLLITPEGCGESAIGSVRVIVDKLRAAGYLWVTVAGSLAKPNAKCAR